jgi:diacylglycerol kinase family enzyme
MGGLMTSVAVIAHSGKQLGGGLRELRAVLRDEGVDEPIWYEVPKSKFASDRAAKVLDQGADLVFAWGGDGLVQRCIDAMAGTGVVLAIVPAGTANLLASNLDIPKDIRGAVSVGLHGARRVLDVGSVNGERFAVMSGTGLDALMIRDADAGLKDRAGQIAYVWTGAKNLKNTRRRARIDVDGERWFSGVASCILVGNVGRIVGGLPVFEHARTDDGRLELGVVTAESVWQWARTLGRTAVGQAERSPFVRMTSAKKIEVRLDRKAPYELDGGDRKPRKRLRFEADPSAITICVPENTRDGSGEHRAANGGEGRHA